MELEESRAARYATRNTQLNIKSFRPSSAIDTERHEIGTISREHQDKTSGSLEHVKRHYTTSKHGIHQVVHAALRRSIGDAYAAVVSQVMSQSLGE